MSNQLPEELIFNGVNASEKSKNRGNYLLKLAPAELEQIALHHTYGKSHLEELEERNRIQTVTAFALEYGRDENNLAEAGWGVIFPARADSRSVEEIRDALSELLDWRKEQAGKLYKEFIGEKGYLPRDKADTFMSRHCASPGTVNPTKIPYYLLIVGDVNEIPYRFQYEMDVTYLVGRIHFKTLEEYAWYAHSVVMAEKSRLNLSRRAVFFGTAHAGDRATQLSSEMLVQPLVNQLRAKKQDWQVDHLPPGDCRKGRLEELLGNGGAPALLFTASHGVGFERDDPMQLPFQGALLCQDLETINETISRQHYLGAEDIRDDFRLHGLVSFHFACFGAGTPQRDSFTRPDRKEPEDIAPSDFLAALPRRLLSHPKGGALAVIGHVDRAWTYSFKWGEAGQQTQTFQDTLMRLMSGQRVGLAVDQFNVKYAQIAARLTGMLDKAEVIRPTLSDLAGLWTANNDARGYALLGDPAVLLPVAKDDEQPRERQVLAPLKLNLREVTSQANEAAKPAPPTQPGATDFAERAGEPSLETGDLELRLQLHQHLKSLAAQIDAFADDLAAPSAADAFEAESFVFGRQNLDELGDKLRQAMQTLTERLKDFADDISTLEVRTYVSDQIEQEDYRDGQFTGARQRALTRINLDGDTQIVVPANAGEVDEVLWEIHSRAVEQAQANRVAMLKAIGELLAGLVPTRR